ncbi:MAG TPA: DUF4097 family beta strand repeat-containing protein [Acidobacteriota bacterium]|nr:DUF4097 family beta strand repeat-containing protein [Acidobacteriota bacterium]
MKRITAIFLTVFLAMGLSALAQSDTFRWNGSLAAGDTLGIHGVNGDVEAIAAAGDQVEVIAHKRGRRSHPDSVQIEVVEHANGITFCAIYPSRRNGQNICTADGLENSNVQNNDVEVRFEVRIPARIHFNGTTVNGGVTAENLDGNVRAHTVNGSIEISTTGWAEAHTVNGSIDASMGAADWEGELSFQTVNGSIELTFPPRLSANLRAESLNGNIRSDFDMDITEGGRRRGWGKQRIRARLAGGSSSRSLDLETVNGDIQIRQGRY